MAYLYDASLAAMAVAVQQKQKAVLAGTMRTLSDNEIGMHGQRLSILRGLLTGEAEEVAQADLGTEEVTYNRLKQELVDIELSTMIRYGWQINIDWSTFVLTPDNVNDYRILIDPAVEKVNRVIEDKAAGAIQAAAALTADPTENEPGTSTPRVLPGIVNVDLSAVDDDKKGKAVRGYLNRANTALAGRTQAGNYISEDIADRFAVLGNEAGFWLLSDDFINSYADSGSDLALRRATVGQLSNFNVVISGKVEANSLFAYSREAFVIFSRTPAESFGAKYSTIEDGGIIRFRYNLDYDTRVAEDTGLLSAFVSVQVVNPQFVVGYKFKFEA